MRSYRLPSAATAGIMIAIANGYFDTIQRNDGTLHTAFSDDCNRREDGFQTTNRKDDTWGDITHLGCGQQFKLGWYRFDDRLRARRFWWSMTSAGW